MALFEVYYRRIIAQVAMRKVPQGVISSVPASVVQVGGLRVED